MSAAACLLSEANFLCSICLDVFNKPVTLLCGHSFCKNCITQNWKINRKCQCPVCKRFFDTSHELNVNIFMMEMVAQFTQSAVEKTSEAAKPGEIPCDMCTRMKLKALKSCLVCRASYCEIHLQRHQTVSGLKSHKLVDPLEDLEERICTMHVEPTELFCKTDQMCVCQFCYESGHETHDVVQLSEECEGRKAELERLQAEFQQMIQGRELKIQELRRSAQTSREAADKETADGVHVFSTLMQFAERGLAELSEKIKKKQEITAKRAEDLIKELDQEILELMKRKIKVQQLLGSDHLHLLQNFSSLYETNTPNTEDWDEVILHQVSFEGSVARAVAHFKETQSKEMTKLLEAELRRVQRYAVDVTLDPNTAHPKLMLSDDGKEVNHCDVENNLPDNPERFSYCVMVLGKQSFSSGRFYYEVEVKGKTKWDLGVASVSANRKGQVTSSPEAGYWTLQLRNGNEYIALADPDIILSVTSQPQKVGVFVDYEEGLVSFYDVDATDIIYSFTDCSFTDRLHPFFSPCFNDGGSNSAPLRISIVLNTD